ncbi:hypothetical protein [Streptococcus uberis]|uniref:hypothetical protein n=1 Tax=Streptococcus uberis TaxID=1349 RepID=UPI001EF03FFD|nr:hypothetical protein [Streptococcus uberis]
MKETVDFLIYLIDAKTREELREIWLAKDFEINLKDFIDKHMPKTRGESITQSVDKDKEAIELAESILSMPIKEAGGDDNRNI